MSWSDDRRLATVTNANSTYAYTYHGDGLRIEKTVDGVTYRYLYDGGRGEIPELVGNGKQR